MPGTFVVLVLCLLVVFPGDRPAHRAPTPEQEAMARPDSMRVSFLALGDINLGRRLGRILLSGDTLHPFAAVRDSFAAYDVVFANLECPVSEQGGETEHPRNNLIFTAPPVAAWSLLRGGIDVVSTANNHALDYGDAAAVETVRWLDSVGIHHAGTATGERDAYHPAVIRRNGLTIALFACTEFVNDAPRGWERRVAAADTGRIFPVIRDWQDSADFRILSYHGGQEYTDRPSPAVRRFMRWAVDAGADLVIGHHPHVPHGLERYRDRWIVHSLGNLVFRQPGRYWAQHGIAVACVLERAGTVNRVGAVRVIPLRADFQPHWLPPGPDHEKVRARVRALSTEGAEEFIQW